LDNPTLVNFCLLANLERSMPQMNMAKDTQN
jgi:hypothetical protein